MYIVFNCRYGMDKSHNSEKQMLIRNWITINVVMRMYFVWYSQLE